MKSCPYCGCMPELSIRKYKRDERNHASSFFYQYNCENKRCKEKPRGSFSPFKKKAEMLWDDGIYMHSPIR